MVLTVGKESASSGPFNIESNADIPIVDNHNVKIVTNSKAEKTPSASKEFSNSNMAFYNQLESKLNIQTSGQIDINNHNTNMASSKTKIEASMTKIQNLEQG